MIFHYSKHIIRKINFSTLNCGRYSVDKLYASIQNSQDLRKTHIKVSIVGAGSVGMAAAFSIATQSFVNVLAIVDENEDKVKGEVLDMQQGLQFINTCSVIGGNEITYTRDSNVVFITAGVRQELGESRLNLVQRNVQVYKSLLPDVLRYSPDCIIVVVSNPVDLLTHLAWKISGLPLNRILGSGTVLDSARFRYMLGHKLNVRPGSIHGYIIGEHGDSSIAAWSLLTIGGVNLSNLNPKIGQTDDPEKFADIHNYVINSAYEIIKLKGYTSWAIGLCCAKICQALIFDAKLILPVSTNLKDLHGIDFDCFMSIPCVIGSDGVSRIIRQQLSHTEEKKLQTSAKLMQNIMDGLAL